MGHHVHLEVDGPIATITNDRPDTHNAFDDAMDAELAAALAEVAGRTPELRAVIWRGEGPSFSSGRDVAAIRSLSPDVTHHQLMGRVRDLAARLLTLPVPMVVAVHGWIMGVSFQRALLGDIRIAADDARFRLPELAHGYLPDAGGVARLTQMCGHGVVSDLVLTGRVMDAAEALDHGIVSRLVPAADLGDSARAVAERIAASPTVTVASARRVIGHLGVPGVLASLDEEMIAQTVVSQSHDLAERRRARREDRAPHYLGT